MKAVDIRKALRAYFNPNEWELAFEVRDAAGFDSKRAIDAIAFNTWPSRGLSLHAIEIKVSSSDLTREIDNPEKAERIARYCDYFWLAMPKGMKSTRIIPEAWGILEVSNGKARLARQAKKTEALEPERTFWASFAKRHGRISHDDIDAALEKRTSELEQSFEDRLQRMVKQQVDLRMSSLREREKAIAILDEMFGGQSWQNADDFVRAAQIIEKSGVAGSYFGLVKVARDLNDMSQRIENSMRDLGIDPERFREIVAASQLESR